MMKEKMANVKLLDCLQVKGIDYLGGRCEPAYVRILSYTVDLSGPKTYTMVKYHSDLACKNVLTMKDGTTFRIINCLDTEPTLEAIKEYITKI